MGVHVGSTWQVRLKYGGYKRVCHQGWRRGLFPNYFGLVNLVYYRAMHYNAKRGLAITCRLSVCLSACDVGGS